MDKRTGKTIYVEKYSKPIRIYLSQETLERITQLQEALPPLRGNERSYVELDLKKAVIKISKEYIDIGRYSYEGWVTYIPELYLTNISKLPDVYFSSHFRMYAFLRGHEDLRRSFWRAVLPEHKPLLVLLKIGEQK